MPQKSIKKNVYSTADAVRLIKGGSEYFSLLEQLINDAQNTIHLQVYIFNENETGLFVANALIRAAQRGVKVYFIVDDFASENLSKKLTEQFKDAGIYFRRFAPLLSSKRLYFGRRLHHKVFVADSKYALVGGINISNRYNDMPGNPAWMDRALYAEGAIANDLVKVCCDVWNKSYDSKDKTKVDWRIEDMQVTDTKPDHISIRVRVNDWVRRRNEVWRSYFEMFNQAEENIIIVCSYFMPGISLRKRMAKAAKRGVKIKVLLGGRSDVPLSKYAERYLYRWMFNNNIEVYEYQKNILHAKLALYDRKLMTIGSYNVNDLSAFVSVELNLDVRNRPFVTEVEQQMLQLIEQDSEQVTEEHYRITNGWLKQVAQRVAYQLVKILLFSVTFYYKQEKN